MRLSKSKIGCFEQCPYHYFLRYIKKIKPEVMPAALKKGIEVHSILDYWNKLEVNTINDATKLIQEHENYPKYKNIINNFIEHNRNMSDDGVYIEMPSFSEMKIENAEINVIGIIDAVYKHKDNILVLDYKTGKARHISGYRFELALYTYLYEQKTGDKVTHWGIFFVEQNQFIFEEVDHNEIEKALKKVETIRQLIGECADIGKWDKKPSYLCNWCEMRQNGMCDK